ncbi:MAG: response regulator [Phycisphaerae bacterium]
MGQSSPKILLAEPDPAARRIVERPVRAAGYDVQTVGTAAEMLLICEVHPPDILIMEVKLPDMDGFEAIQHVRHQTRDTDLTIIITTDATDEMTRRYLGPMVDYAGGDFFFSKPCDGQLIVELLEELSGPTTPLSTGGRSGFPTRVVWPTSRSRLVAVHA